MTTLAEREYFLGLAGLLNSMAHYGTYIDKVIVGYREALPDWLPPLYPSTNGQAFKTGSGLEVELVELNGSLHMVHEKPKWFLHVSEVLAPDADEYFFFDSDIIINARMDFYGEWVQNGICMCGDVNFIFDRSHPVRLQWVKYAAEAGRKVTHQIDGYYNSGFLGWTRETKQFIHDWNEAFAMMVPHSGNMNKFRAFFDRTVPVLSTNQDSFNLAAMITDQPLTLVGPEGMGFNYGMRLMHHPLGPKPWSRNFLSDFFKGIPPREADVVFWKYVNGSELKPVSSGKAWRMRNYCKALRFASRFYQRLTN